MICQKRRAVAKVCNKGPWEDNWIKRLDDMTNELTV